MRVLLLALTGTGNAVLNACITRCGVGNLLVVTRGETGPYPYYACENLTEACESAGVTCLTGADLREPGTQRTLADFAPDIMLVATFHQIVGPRMLRLAPLGTYNIHPSLLPAYRGPMPTNWAIIHGEQTTGVTVHEMTSELDKGRIALQEAVDIGGENDGELRRKLAGVSASLAGRLLETAAAGTVTLREQKGAGSYHPRVLSRQGIEIIRTGNFAPENIRRGLAPWPGAEALARALEGGTDG